MTSHISPAPTADAFQHLDASKEEPTRSGAWRPAWLEPLRSTADVLDRLSLPSRRKDGAASPREAEDDLGDIVWPSSLPARSAPEVPGDWVFPSYFLCMAVAALPLIGLRWTTPEGMTTWHAFSDAAVFSLPVIIPLPLLLLSCIGLLISRPASRTKVACSFFCAGLLLGLAALSVLCIGR